MPDDRANIPQDEPDDDFGPDGMDYELDIEPDELIAMLMEGLADIEAGRVHTMAEANRMIDEALEQQRAERTRQR